MKSTSKQFPGFERIFKIKASGSEDAFVGSMGLPDGCDPIALLRGEYVPSVPIQVTWAMGCSEPRDIIGTTWASPLIVSRKVISTLTDNGFSGWSTYPVLVKNKAGNLLEGFAGLSVTGRCGPIDNSRCVRVEGKFPGGGFPVYRGLYFDESRWDGSDIFCSANKTGHVFVTWSAKLAFERAQIRTVRFRATNEIERSTL